MQIQPIGRRLDTVRLYQAIATLHLLREYMVWTSGEIRLSTINIDKLITEWNKFETVTKSDDDCENNK